MTGVILAAGRGGRLRGITGDLPKCLARVGSLTLVERQIALLRACGVTPITVVTGHRSDDVGRVCGGGIQFVCNPRFASTNSLYSLWLARDLLSDGFVVLNCDVLFQRQLLEDLLTARYEDAVLASSRDPEAPYTEEEMKIRIRGGRVVAISKTIADQDADGENIGIAKFGPAGSKALIEEMNRLVLAGTLREWLPAAFEAFCRRRPLHVVESRGFPWIEIDSPEDYWRACSEILPAIETLDALSRPPTPAARRGGKTAATGRKPPSCMNASTAFENGLSR